MILLGAGLSAILIYALTSELFSPNSPTVLYGDACDRIKASKKVAAFLRGPLVFHNNPPSAIRPRHRNRHVSSQIFVDSTGREHMILNFYVEGKALGTLSTEPSKSPLDAVVGWTGDKTSVLTMEWVWNAWERSKRVFRYLSGAPLVLPEVVITDPEVERKKSTGWNFVGIFSSVRGNINRAGRGSSSWTDGEVHADLIRNDHGYFEFRYLLIDIPNSRNNNPIRVFVERSNGVRENEPTIRWH